MNDLLSLEVVLSAVITAFLTTLSVEYFAKPWLEARKERILDEHRRRRDLQARLIDLAIHAGTLSKMGDLWDLAPNVAASTVEDYERAAAQARSLLPVLHNWRIPTEVIKHASHGIGRLQGALTRLRASLEAPASARERAIRSVLDAQENLIAAADYIILKGRFHQQPLISRVRTRRAARKDIRRKQESASESAGMAE